MDIDITPELELKNDSNRHMKIPRIINNYKLLRKINETTSYIIIEVQKQDTGENYAMKCIPIESFKGFKQFDHSNIIQVKETFKFPRTCSRFAVEIMPLACCNLYDYMKINYSKGFMQEDEVKKIMKDLFEAVDYLHKNRYCHGDIRLENILIMSKKDNIKIALAALNNMINHRDEYMTIHPPTMLSYAAPELLKQDRLKLKDRLVYNDKIDSWSLGIVMFELLLSQHPYMGRIKFELPKLLNGVINFELPQFKDISPEAQNLLRHLICPDPDRRYTIEQAIDHDWFKI